MLQKEIIQYLQVLFVNALILNQLKGYDVWFKISGHVHQVSLCIKKNNKELYNNDFYYDGPNCCLSSVIINITIMNKLLILFINQN